MDKINKKRDWLNVIFDILKIIKDNQNSIKITLLQRFSNLSSSNFLDYYNELIAKEFIKNIFDKIIKNTLFWQ